MSKFLLCLFCLISSSLVWADSRVSGADGLEEAYQLMQEMRNARHELMSIWIDCQLDNLCVCTKKEALYDKTNNFALRVIIDKDRKGDKIKCDRMREDYELCQIPLIVNVNKAMVPCYKRIRDGIHYNDKSLYDDGAICLAEKLQPFVEQGNPYAMHVFVDYLSHRQEKYPGMLSYYSKKLDAMKDSLEYKSFLQCQDFLN